jgi:S1-C subfamily serine protease
MAWDRAALIRLRELLARLYPTERDARRVAGDAGLNAALVAFDAKAINTWFAILDEARNQGKVEAVVEVALADYPDEEALLLAARAAPPPLLDPPELTDWHGPKGAGQLEKIIGTQSTLVSISYLEVGLVRARSVAKLRLADGSSGTGFLIAGATLVTNHHVLPDAAAAAGAAALFNYQLTASGTSAEPDERALVPGELFKTSAQDDWSMVRVAGDPNGRWGALELAPATVKVGDRVNIIQHPAGLPKQVSLDANVVVFTGQDRLQYLTDTEPGSSGSPVFDREWRVVGVHHSGGWLAEPNAPGPARTFYRNEGILVDALIAGLHA